MKRYIRTNSTSDYIRKNQNMPKGGYLYIFKHGVGPGTLPRDVEIIRTKDLPNHYTAVWLDRFLTTEEMDEYDIPYETEINRYLDRIGYCQKNGDVVPCDDIDACDEVTASIDSDISRYKKSLERKASKSGVYENFGADEVRKLREKYRTLPDDDTDYFTAEHNSSSISSFENWCRNYVQSCDTKYFANMVSCSMNGTQAIAYKNIKHCFENLTGEWYNCILDGCPEYIPDSLEEAKQLVYEECLVNKYDEGYCGSGKAPKEMRFAGTQFIRDSIDKLFSEDKDGDVACCAEEKGWH